MRDPRHLVGPGEHQRLMACAREVKAARAHLDAARHGAIRRWEKQALRSELLIALEGYVAAIVALGAPVPRTLSSEIELYRRLENRG